MKGFLIAISLVAAAAFGQALSAQMLVPPGGSQFNPPLPRPPPPPRIEVPVVPKMDAMPSRNYLPAPGPSFSDKITNCLAEGAAGGLGPGDRDAYSRACANSR